MTRSGLTLLEVVLATALLALATVAIASVMSAIPTPSDTSSHFTPGFASSIDDVLRDPSRYELNLGEIAKIGLGEFDLGDRPIQVSLQARSGRGAWLEFSNGVQSTARWILMPQESP